VFAEVVVGAMSVCITDVHYYRFSTPRSTTTGVYHIYGSHSHHWNDGEEGPIMFMVSRTLSLYMESSRGFQIRIYFHRHIACEARAVWRLRVS
jgi:hypothetical protein